MAPMVFTLVTIQAKSVPLDIYMHHARSENGDLASAAAAG
jgi:hypothetical protein